MNTVVPRYISVHHLQSLFSEFFYFIFQCIVLCILIDYRLLSISFMQRLFLCRLRSVAKIYINLFYIFAFQENQISLKWVKTQILSLEKNVLKWKVRIVNLKGIFKLWREKKNLQEILKIGKKERKFQGNVGNFKNLDKKIYLNK